MPGRMEVVHCSTQWRFAETAAYFAVTMEVARNFLQRWIEAYCRYGNIHIVEINVRHLLLESAFSC